METFKRSGLAWHTNTLRLVGYGIGMAICMICIVSVIALALGARFIPHTPTVDSMISAIALLLLWATIEELIFRGPIFEFARKRLGPTVAVLGSGALFGVMHAMNPDANTWSIMNTALAGIFIGVLVTQSHSLYAAISFHASWNVLVGLLVGNVSGIDLGIGLLRLDLSSVSQRWLFGNTYGIEEGALTTGLLVLASVVAIRTVPLDAETRAARYRRSFLSTTHAAT
ncbi:MAG: CPBP family intramembrane glutamic endopeptidase [bacterium]|nr:CPBP family intramembrane glutamic endopeptidase [bacterium]